MNLDFILFKFNTPQIIQRLYLGVGENEWNQNNNGHYTFLVVQ